MANARVEFPRWTSYDKRRSARCVECGPLNCHWYRVDLPGEQENTNMNFVAFILAILGFVALLLPGISGLSSLLG